MAKCIGTLEGRQNEVGATRWHWTVTKPNGEQETSFAYSETLGLRDLESALRDCERKARRWQGGVSHPSGSGPRRGFAGAMPPGFKSFTMADFGFEEPAAPPPRTKADDFRFSQVGDTFEAGGVLWKVRRVLGGYQERLVQEAADHLHAKGSFFAQLHDDGVLTVHAVSKRGEFRPVGRALVREKVR